MDNQFVFNRLANGQQVKTSICNCGRCNNEFYVPALSDEWKPNFCPYCGIQFIRQDFDGQPVDYKPTDPEETSYELGKRDGYSDAVQTIDVKTGGDGEYYFSTDGTGCETPEQMIEKIVKRFETGKPVELLTQEGEVVR